MRSPVTGNQLSASLTLALQLVASLPASAAAVPTRDQAKMAVALLPLAGVLVGAVPAAVWLMAIRLWTAQPLVAPALTLAAAALTTAGRSLGDLGRSADGLAAGGDRPFAFAVMRDPRRGAAGIVAIAVAVALRLAFVSALAPASAVLAIILASALGRWVTAFAISAFPQASGAGAGPESGHGFADSGPNEFLAASVLVIACAALLPTRGLLTMVGVGAVAAPIAQSLFKRLGGLNRALSVGLGEIGEIVALACLAIR